MKVIHKYAVPIQDEAVITTRFDARILHVGEQYGELVLWALCDLDALVVQRRLRIVGTGHPLGEDPGHHLGTVQMSNGLVWHVFDVDMLPLHQLRLR